MNYTTIKPALKTWAATFSGLPAIWEDEANNWIQKTRVQLRIRNSRGQGVDEVRVTDTGAAIPASNMRPTFAGVRLFTLEIRAVGRDQRAGYGAIDALELLRDSLARDAVKAAHRTAGCAFAQVLAEPADVSVVVDGRMESQAVMELLFNAAANTTDASAAVGAIETVEVSSTLLPSAGVDMDSEILP